MTLKKQFLNGFAWTYIHQISTQLISFLTTLFFARLLEPSEIGIMSLLLVYLQVVSLIVSGGMGYSLIRLKDIDDEDYSTVFWYNLSTGVFLYFLFFITAPIIASFYNQIILIDIIRIVTISFIIGSLSIVQRARFTQIMNFRIQLQIAVPRVVQYIPQFPLMKQSSSLSYHDAQFLLYHFPSHALPLLNAQEHHGVRIRQISNRVC